MTLYRDSILEKSTTDVTPEEWVFLENEGIVNGCGANNNVVRVKSENNWLLFFLLFPFFYIITKILSYFRPPLAIFYKASCSKHDFGYAKGGDSERRKYCDDNFLAYMVADCYHAYTSGQIELSELSYYIEWAIKYHKAVRLLGWVRFTYTNFQTMNGIETATVATLKVWFFSTAFVFLEYFSIPTEPFTLLGVLMLFDMTTGIGKASRLGGWDSVTSNSFWWGITKKIFTLLGICSIAIAIKGMGFEGYTFISICLSAFIAAETYSVIQNIYIINSGKKVTEWNATAVVFKALASFFRVQVETQADKIGGKKKDEESNQ